MICTLSSGFTIYIRYYMIPLIQVKNSTQSTLSLIFRKENCKLEPRDDSETD